MRAGEGRKRWRGCAVDTEATGRRCNGYKGGAWGYPSTDHADREGGGWPAGSYLVRCEGRAWRRSDGGGGEVEPCATTCASAAG